MRFPLAPARSWSMAARNSARLRLGAALVGAAFLCAPGAAGAADCPVTHDRLVKALKASVKPAGGPKNGGFENHEWAGVVARDGTVCAVAVSGDTSCADHNVAWRMRDALGLNKIPAGVNPNRKDAIVFDLGVDGKSAS